MVKREKEPEHGLERYRAWFIERERESE